jgi:hypothetical protein
MTTVHDDLPHPVPAFAHLRYKENYFFILIAKDAGVYGVVHLNHEPGFDRARYTANLCVRGKMYLYSNTTPFPKDFAFSRQIGDERLRLAFVEPHERFDLTLVTEELDLQCRFTAAQPTFDYGACRTAGGPRVSFQELMTLGTNLQYDHQQQALRSSGSVKLAGSGETVAFDGAGYRDHSWVMRADNLSAQHIWCGFVFPSVAFGAKIMETLPRPGLWAREGYVADREGLRAFTDIQTRNEGGQTADGLPRVLVHEFTDVFGRRYTIESDLGGRLAHVPLVSEAPGGRPLYQIVENFCRSKVRETGEAGVSLVEVGRAPSIGGPFT